MLGSCNKLQSLLLLFPGGRFLELLLCAVEVYSEPKGPVWPDLSYLKPTVSLAGESCKEACMQHKMVTMFGISASDLMRGNSCADVCSRTHIQVCEPAYFRFLNTERALRRHLGCKGSFHTLETKYCACSENVACIHLSW